VLTKPYIRRAVAVLLVVLGAMMILLAPATWAGVLLLVLGVSVELIGMALKHRNQP
jgi:membrane-bound ClpP family serine protease